MSVNLPPKDRFTVREVARILDKHISTIWRWCLRPVRGRILKTIHIGGQRYVERADLEAFLDEQNDAVKNTRETNSAACCTKMAKIEAALDEEGI